MAIKHSEKVEVLLISACPADLQLCLGVLRKQSSQERVLMLVTWATHKVVERVSRTLQNDEGLDLKVQYSSALDAYAMAQEKRWGSIYLFTMGTDWLGKILFERKDVLRYRDCYIDYQQLGLRDIKWEHLTIIKFHGLKHWLKLQALRALTFFKYYKYKLAFRPDMHVWPQTQDIQRVWYETAPDTSLKLGMLPENAVIFCLSSIDNGWAPNWDEIRKISNNFYFKLHPRTGRADYLEYPDWVTPLEGYDLPVELYGCPESSQLIGTTSTALGATKNSMSLWRIKLLDWEKMNSENSVKKGILKKPLMSYLNCRSDLHHLYNAYAQRAAFMPKSHKELINYITTLHH